MEAWVIKRDDGKYLKEFSPTYVLFCYHANRPIDIYTSDIYGAKIFKSIEEAKWYIIESSSQRAVKIKINGEEVEENE